MSYNKTTLFWEELKSKHFKIEVQTVRLTLFCSGEPSGLSKSRLIDWMSLILRLPSGSENPKHKIPCKSIVHP